MKRILSSLAALAVLAATACSTSESAGESPIKTTEISAQGTSATSNPTQSWVEVFSTTATENDRPVVTTEEFELNGHARLRYVVTGTLVDENEPKSKAATIMFQDEKLNTESSRIDTTIDVEEPGEKTIDLGERRGTYFLMIRPANGLFGDNWHDLTVSVAIEQVPSAK